MKEVFDLMIAASPTGPFCVMVTQETDEVDADCVFRQNCLANELDEVMDFIFDTYAIKTACVYGNPEYIKGVGKAIIDWFPDVKLIPAGV